MHDDDNKLRSETIMSISRPSNQVIRTPSGPKREDYYILGEQTIETKNLGEMNANISINSTLFNHDPDRRTKGVGSRRGATADPVSFTQLAANVDLTPRYPVSVQNGMFDYLASGEICTSGEIGDAATDNDQSQIECQNGRCTMKVSSCGDETANSCPLLSLNFPENGTEVNGLSCRGISGSFAYLPIMAYSSSSSGSAEGCKQAVDVTFDLADSLCGADALKTALNAGAVAGVANAIYQQKFFGNAKWIVGELSIKTLAARSIAGAEAMTQVMAQGSEKFGICGGFGAHADPLVNHLNPVQGAMCTDELDNESCNFTSRMKITVKVGDRTCLADADVECSSSRSDAKLGDVDCNCTTSNAVIDPGSCQ